MSTPRALVHGPSVQAQLDNTAGPWTWAQVAQERWSSQRALGPVPSSCGTTSKSRVPSDPGRGHPVQLVEPGLSRPGQLVNTVYPRTRAQVTQHSSSTPWYLGYGPESPRISGQNHEPSDPFSGTPGQLFDPAGLRTRDVSSGHLVDTTGRRTRARVPRDSRSAPWAHVQGPVSDGRAGRNRGPSE